MNNTRPIPQPGERWRHYKLKDGKEYIANIIGISYLQDTPDKYVIYSSQPLKFNNRLYTKVLDTESDSCFLLEQVDSSNPEYAFFLLFKTTKKYSQNDIDHNTIWVRPLDDFMELLSSPYIGDLKSNYYRFEKVD